MKQQLGLNWRCVVLFRGVGAFDLIHQESEEVLMKEHFFLMWHGYHGWSPFLASLESKAMVSGLTDPVGSTPDLFYWTWRNVQLGANLLEPWFPAKNPSTSFNQSRCVCQTKINQLWQLCKAVSFTFCWNNTYWQTVHSGMRSKVTLFCFFPTLFFPWRVMSWPKSWGQRGRGREGERERGWVIDTDMYGKKTCLTLGHSRIKNLHRIGSQLVS